MYEFHFSRLVLKDYTPDNIVTTMNENHLSNFFQIGRKEVPVQLSINLAKLFIILMK